MFLFFAREGIGTSLIDLVREVGERAEGGKGDAEPVGVYITRWDESLPGLEPGEVIHAVYSA